MMDYLDHLNDSEYRVIEALDENDRLTQRHIAEKAGISLGMTNLIIKRLIRRGFVKIRNMDKKKILYHLTPKAVIEKTRRTYNYFERTMRDIVAIREKIQTAVLDKMNGRYTEIVIVGRNEVSEIAKWAVQDIDRSRFKVSHKSRCENPEREDVLIINCDRKSVDGEHSINILKII